MKIWRNVMFVVFLTVFAAGRYAHLGACGVFLDVMEDDHGCNWQTDPDDQAWGALTCTGCPSDPEQFINDMWDACVDYCDDQDEGCGAPSGCFFDPGSSFNAYDDYGADGCYATCSCLCTS